MGNVMVINMGLKSVRCILFDFEGTKLGSAAEPIKTAINDKCVEQNPEEWWSKTQSVMKKVVGDSKGMCWQQWRFSYACTDDIR